MIDWTAFTRRISIKADKEVLFKSWLTQDQLESWFLKKADFYSDGLKRERDENIQVGDSYIWMWHGSESVAEGEVLEINLDELILKMSFLGCSVTVNIKEEANENLIELVQSEIGEDDESKLNYYVECTRGWTFYLANLKSIHEGGIDLRNMNDGLVHVINT